MKIYKYVLLHFVIRHHYSRLSWAFNFSYRWLLRCVTRSRYRPRASVGIPDVGNTFYHIFNFKIGERRPPASGATLTTDHAHIGLYSAVLWRLGDVHYNFQPSVASGLRPRSHRLSKVNLSCGTKLSLVQFTLVIQLMCYNVEFTLKRVHNGSLWVSILDCNNKSTWALDQTE